MRIPNLYDYKMTYPVIRRYPLATLVHLPITPHVEVGIHPFTTTALLKPSMFVGSVVWYKVDDHLHI